MTTTMKFTAALALLEQGANIRRESWAKNWGMALQRPDAQSKMSVPYLYLFASDGHREPDHFSGDDVLADDWTAEVDGKPVPAPAQDHADCYLVAGLTKNVVRLKERLGRAEQTLRNLGYTDEGGMQWKPPVDTDVEFKPAPSGKFEFEIKAGHIAGMRMAPSVEAVDVTSGINDEYVKVLEEQLDRAKAALYGAGFAPCDSTGFWRR